MTLNIYSRFATDSSLEIEGVPVDLGDGASITVARWNNCRHREALERLRRPYRGMLLAGRELPTDVAETISIEAMAEAILIGWNGIVDGDGKSLPYSKVEAVRILTELRDFRDQVAYLAFQAENFRAEAIESAEKN